MPAPFYTQVLASNRASGPVVATWTTAKSVLDAADLVQLPINYLYVGAKFRIRVAGVLSNIVTTPGTVTFQVMMGAVVAWTSGAIQMTTTANTTTPIVLEIILRVTALDTGSGQTPVTAATLFGNGFVAGLDLTIGAGANPTVTDTIAMIPATAPVNGTVFASSTTENLDFWVGFSLSGNVFSMTDYIVEQLQ